MATHDTTKPNTDKPNMDKLVMGIPDTIKPIIKGRPVSAIPVMTKTKDKPALPVRIQWPVQS